MGQTFHQEQRGPNRPSFNPILSGNYASDFAEAMRCAGLNFKEHIIGDGPIHRFPTDNKNNDQDSWYVFYGMAGAFGDWRRDIREKWSINMEASPDPDKGRGKENTTRLSKRRRLKREKKARGGDFALISGMGLSKTGSSAYLGEETSGRLWCSVWG